MHADGDRFLAVVEMQKSADLLLGVELRATILELPDAQHLPQQRQRVLAIEGDARRVAVMLRSPASTDRLRADRAPARAARVA